MERVFPHRIRLGIIGCGAITESAHLPAALSSSAVELTALCDQSEPRRNYLQRLFGLKAIGFHDHRDVMAHVDAVILALPNHLHASIGCDLLSRGIHVLCEKPLATSRSECDQLCQAARSTNSILAVGYFTRFYPSTDLTKNLLESRFLGDITAFEYEQGAVGGWAPHSGYNLTRATSGGGVLVVNGSHFIDRMLFLFGPAEVISFVDDSRGGIEANCIATFECTSTGHAVRGRVTLSKTHALANRLLIIGQAGILEVGDNQTRSVTFSPAANNLRHEISSKAGSVGSSEDDFFQRQLEDFVRAIQTGTEPKVSGAAGLQSVALMERCYQLATPMDEPWVDAPLERLKEILPSDALPSTLGAAREIAVH
jgi:UDP-N-acetylglucosamine 3-dehydrogenase